VSVRSVNNRSVSDRSVRNRSTSVRDYYNGNTRSFLRPWRSSSSTGAIHRALWAPGISNRIDAMNYVHQLILEQLATGGAVTAGQRATARALAGDHPENGPLAEQQLATDPPLLVDLGCGVGATLLYIRHHLSRHHLSQHAGPPRDNRDESEPSLAGITLSEVQAEIARERLGPAVPIVTGDYTQPASYETITRGGLQPISAAWMIESFVHAPDAAALLETIARYTGPGGLLVICDDLLSDEYPSGTIRAGEKRASEMRAGDTRAGEKRASEMPAAEQQWLDEFRRGWHAQSLMSAPTLAGIAARAGFGLVHRVDLSSYVRSTPLGGVPVHATAALGRALRLTSPRWSNFRGGSALQRLGQAGIIRYQMLVLRRGQGHSSQDQRGESHRTRGHAGRDQQGDQGLQNE
jgi:SAM-dependent methyltransferase